VCVPACVCVSVCVCASVFLSVYVRHFVCMCVSVCVYHYMSACVHFACVSSGEKKRKAVSM
jgi:hypothetical protein